MPADKTLSTFKLIMMSVVAIDSLKNLPANAQYGSLFIIYYVLAIIVFFIPSALVSAELATSWPATGGIYIWVREAFNKRLAFMVIWVQTLIAITWYPSILSFIAATLAYLFSPELASNKYYVFFSLQFFFWGATLLISFGLRISSLVSTVSAIIGVIIPMLLFIGLGFIWLYNGRPSEIHFHSLFATEKFITEDHLRLLVTLLYSLMGMEIIATHAGDVKNPQQNYPRAILYSALIILLTVIPSSLTIAMVLPNKDISLTTGIVDAFTLFLHAFHLEWLKPFFIIAIAIGSFGIFLTWLLTGTRCLLLAAHDGALPASLQRTNRYDMPIFQLLMQGIVFSALSFIFVFLPSVNGAFWFFSATAAQFALIYYIFLFAAAVRLRFKYKHSSRPFQVGKHPLILTGICLLGSLSCFMAFCFGFLPPPEIDKDHVLRFELLLIGLIVGGCISGWLIYSFFHADSRRNKFKKQILLASDASPETVQL